MVISMRDGVEIYIEEKKLEPLMPLLETKRFIKIEKEVINTADISGVYLAKTIENKTRRKNGQWQDEYGWHDKGESKVSPPPYYDKDISEFANPKEL